MSLLARVVVTVLTVYSLVPSLHSTTYVQTRLEEQCLNRKSKLKMKLKSQVNIITFNSTKFTEPSLHCHLELSVPSTEYGLSVFIEEMKLGSCDEDFVQFGRDILFVTTHLSKRYCGHYERPSFASQDGVRTASLPSHTVEHRYYTEQSDSEMDMWIVVKRPRHKLLTLVVTPFKKRCSSSDRSYIQCGEMARCVRRNLFCDGRVNCEWPHGQPADESQCKEEKVEPEVEPSSGVGRLVLVLMLVVLVLVVGGGLVHVHHRRQPARRTAKLVSRPVQGQEDLLTTGLCADLLPSSPPLQPPPPYAPPCTAPPVPPRQPPRYEVIWS